MSKLYDIEKIYGQDFGIAVTNAPSTVVKKSSNLLKNILLISSPEDGWENGEGNKIDEGNPALFATDYEGNPVQLTYPIKTGDKGNGLDIDDDGALTLKIDGKTIKSQEKLDDGEILKGLPLFVDTTNLDFARLNDLDNRGVVNVSDYIPISRNASDFNDSNSAKSMSGISITSDGCLYISELFLNELLNYVQNSIENKIKPLAKENMNASISIDDENLILYTGVNPYQTEAIGTKSENGYYNVKKMTLNFISESDKPIEGISLPVVSGNMIIKINGKDTGTSEVDTEKPYLILGDYKQYNHTIKNIEAVIYPNYNIINNQFTQTTNAFKIDGIKDPDKTVREYPSVSFTQAAMENNSDNGFLFKITNSISMDLNYTMESNIISVSMGSSININYRGLYSYTNQDKRYEPIQYKYKIFIGPQEIYEGTIEPNSDNNIKSISVGYSDINDQNSSTLDIIKNSSVRDNTGQIQILASSSTYNKLYAILYIYLPGQEPFQYESNKINVNHKNVGNFKNVVFKFAPSECSGNSVSTSSESHALSLNSGNNNLVSYILNNVRNEKVKLKIILSYSNNEYPLKGYHDINSVLFTPQDGTTPIVIQNTNSDSSKITGEGTYVTLEEREFNVMTNYIIKTSFSEDNPNFSTDSDFTLNLYEIILNRLRNAIQFETSSGANVSENAEIRQEYVYIKQIIRFNDSINLSITIGENSNINYTIDNGKYKIKLSPDPVNIELIVKQEDSEIFTFRVTKQMPIYKLGIISNIEFTTDPIRQGEDNTYKIGYRVIYSGNDIGGHIPETVTFNPDSVATLQSINQTNYESGNIFIKVHSNESCKMTFGVRGTNYVTKEIEYNFGTVQEPTNARLLQSFIINVNGKSMSTNETETAVINLNEPGTLTIVPYPDTAQESYNIDSTSKHIIVTQDNENDNQFIITGLDESGTEDLDKITITPVTSNVESQDVNIEVSKDSSTSGIKLNSISWSGNSGDSQTITNGNTDVNVGTLTLDPNNANGYNVSISFIKDGSVIESGITTNYISNTIYISPSLNFDENEDYIVVTMNVHVTGNVASNISDLTKTLTINKNENYILNSFNFANDSLTNPLEIEQLSIVNLNLNTDPENSLVLFNWSSDSNDIQLTPSTNTHSCSIKGNNIGSNITLTVEPIGNYELTPITKTINVVAQSGGTKSIMLTYPNNVNYDPLSGLTISKNETITITGQPINCTGTISWEINQSSSNPTGVIISDQTANSCKITGNTLSANDSYDCTLIASLTDNGDLITAEVPIKIIIDESNDPTETVVESGTPSYARYFKAYQGSSNYTEIIKSNGTYSTSMSTNSSINIKAKIYTANGEVINNYSVTWSSNNSNYTINNSSSNPCQITSGNEQLLSGASITCNYGLLSNSISISSRTLIPTDLDP